MSENLLTVLAVVIGFPLSLTIVLFAIIVFTSLGDFLFGSRGKPQQ
ncbi:MAG: hypothetical protein ACO3NK_01605 [Prochlorotrichaceae cyanobacterium]|jgi:hypothetical protein